jgi:hypothetical protein
MRIRQWQKSQNRNVQLHVIDYAIVYGSSLDDKVIVNPDGEGDKE